MGMRVTVRAGVIVKALCVYTKPVCFRPSIFARHSRAFPKRINQKVLKSQSELRRFLYDAVHVQSLVAAKNARHSSRERAPKPRKQMVEKLRKQRKLPFFFFFFWGLLYALKLCAQVLCPSFLHWWKFVLLTQRSAMSPLYSLTKCKKTSTAMQRY